MAILGTGWFGILFFWGFYTGVMPIFLRGFTGSKFLISLMLSLAGVSGCIVPPIAGYFSDRTHGRFGRRKPYILFGMLGMFACMMSLPYTGALGLIACISGATYMFMDIAQTPYMSLLPDITPPSQRGTASGVMNLLGGMGLIASFFACSQVWDEYPKMVFSMVAAVCCFSVVFAIALLRGPDKPEENSLGETTPIRYLRSIAKETDALKFFLAQFFWWLGFWVVQAFITLFLVEELGVGEGKSLLAPMIPSIVQTVLVLPSGALGDRVGRRGLLLSAVAFWTAAILTIGFSRSFTQALITLGISGIPLAVVMGVGYAYMLDLIPKERTAEFVGIGVVSMAAPQIFGPLIGGKLIDTFGYRSIFPVASVFMFISFCALRSIRARST
ncbi:MAG: MFS transporter [Candidatus Abyssobacteria bacterium SURF_17]|jgi:MFS family permease|uniref:MFS transporter n=1 Tax=Candidatus Abyssobacteria bacterium SURF_17 TaxID=2093361 RepID=A0A419F892_9BACT|nr:MAG: MFS transporter [Candidatus Abyssubacteria bacterium SURF_17]